MDAKQTRLLIEAVEAINENEHEAIQNAFGLEGVGELIEHTFREAQSAQELQAGIIGMATELHNSMKAGNYEIAQDMGLTDLGAIKEFMEFASGVANQPEYFFDMYQSTLNPLDDQGGM